MLRFSRYAALVIVLLATAGCAAYSVAIAPETQAQVASLLKLSPESITLQGPCVAGVSGARTTAPVSCIFVETAQRLYFLKFRADTKTYVPAVSLDPKEISGVALARFGLNRQIQLRHRGELMAFHLVGAALVDTKTTELIYERLLKAGVAAMQPEEWINLVSPPSIITIPIYVR